MAQQAKKFLIIDANALVHRAFHALPPLKTKKGEIVNAVYGFCLILFKALRDIRPDFVVACFDVAGPTFRHEASVLYKAKRKKAPDELYNQLKEAKTVLSAFKIPVFEQPGFEADDLIGTIAEAALKKQVLPKIENIILTGDMDALQLVNRQTKVYAMRKGIKDIVLFDIEKVKEKMGGLKPEQIVDFKALRGDASDNIPGVAGIGEKTAIGLLLDFQTLENLYQAIEKSSPKLERIKPSVLQKLKDYKEQAFISKTLAQINCQVPVELKIEEARFGRFEPKQLIKILNGFEFYTLVPKALQFSLQEAQTEPKPSNNQKQLFLSSQNQAGQDSTETQIKKLEKQGVFSAKVARLELGLVVLVKQMEANGIKINLVCLNKMSLSLEKQITDLENNIFRSSGQKFNPNSPQQVAEILFNKLAVSTDRVRKTPTGAASTNARELEKLKEAHPVVPLLLQYRELFKLKSGFVDALPRMLNPKTGRIHPKFHQLGAETGRMSCSEPNLQNIPIKGIGLEIRKCFVPEPGFEFLSADYSQMELRVAAAVSGDKTMQAAFRQGKDIHQITASQVFGIAEDKVATEQREMAKALNFGVLYGMGPVAFADRIGISRQEAKDFIEKYFEQFSGLKRYLEYSREKAKKQGYAITALGRKRLLPEIHSRDQRLRAQAERMAVNLPLQGYSADIMKLAMLDIKKAGLLDKSCRLLLQIHDELLFEVEKEKTRPVAQKIKKIMEKAVKLGLPLKVDIKTGASWGSLQKIETCR